MHIGLPLGVLLLMFIHVQRVPKARTHPPRTIMLSLLATLLLLALVRPVLSQGVPNWPAVTNCSSTGPACRPDRRLAAGPCR
jgi:hypothetical protein